MRTTPSPFVGNHCAGFGPGWIDARDPKTGQRRLDNPSDFARIEIGEALARGIPVVPVLIDGTPMPEIHRLPDDLKALVDRQAGFVEYRTFEADVERLIKQLRLSEVANAPKEAAGATTQNATPAEQSREGLERPLIYITDVGSFKFDRKSPLNDPVVYVTYSVANYGKTPAIIEQGRGICHGVDYRIATGPDRPLAFDHDHPLVGSPIIQAGEVRRGIREDVAANSVQFTTDEHFTLQTIDDVVPVKNVYKDVFLWIILSYRGPFTDHHEISGCWRWEEGTRRFIRHAEHNCEK